MKDTKKFFKITFAGIMIALMAVFSWTVLGMVPLGTLSATTVFIPVVVGIIILDDFRYTILLSLSFGLMSLIRALSPQGAFDGLFINPCVSVLPRLIMGLLTNLFYRFISKNLKNKNICAMLTGGVCALTNTFFTISSLIIFCFNDLMAYLQTIDNFTIFTFITTIMLTNMIPEIVLGMIVCYAVFKAYNSIKAEE